MQLVYGFIATVSAHDLVYFSIALCILVLNYWATTRIVRQAGYSSAWIVVPLVPLAITVVFHGHCLQRPVRPSARSADRILRCQQPDRPVAVGRTERSAPVALFLIFAFSRWPVSSGRIPPRDRNQRPAPSSVAAKGVGVSRSASPGSNPTSLLSPPTGGARTLTDGGGGGGVAPPVAVAGPRKVIFCGWCGEATPGNRALSHDCGSKDRPMTSCRFCGKPFAEGADSCSECFA
jgi:hypothetical protein